MQNLISSRKSPYFSTGNLCGHNPNAIRDLTFKKESNRPRLIQKAIKIIRKKIHKLPVTRSEGREALFQLLLKCLYDFELSTQTVCNNDITFSRPTLRDITRDVCQTGLSYSRSKKAQRKAIEAGFLEVIRCPDYEKYKKGEWASDPSKRHLTPKFFAFLSSTLAMSLNTQIHYKRIRLEKRKIKIYRKKEEENQLKVLKKYGQFKAFVSPTQGQFEQKNSLPRISKEEENRLRNQYLKILKLRSPSIDNDILSDMAMRSNIDVIKKLIEQHNHKKDTEPP